MIDASEPLPLTAIAYTFEVESERRRLGLPSRVTFLNKSTTDPDFQLRGMLDLRMKNRKECTSTRLQLQVLLNLHVLLLSWEPAWIFSELLTACLVA